MVRLWNKLNRIEQIMLSVAVVVFSVSVLAQFYYRGFLGDEIAPEDQIAQVLEITDEIRRRQPTSFEFNSVKNGDRIGNGDTIFSGKNSKVLVKFIKGSRLVIGEQSLVVLREINGKIDMNIEKGGVSGVLTDAEQLEIKTEEDEISINGEENSQFTVSYKPGMGLEIQSFDKEVKLGYRGTEVGLKQKKAVVSRKKGVVVSDSMGIQDGREVAAAQDEPEKKLPEGVKLNDPKDMTERRLSLGAPFPLVNHVFLHSESGQIPIYPKEQCVDGCEIVLDIVGVGELKKSFGKNTIPLFYMQVESEIEASVKWKFRDGPETKEGQFEILKYNEMNMGRAIKDRKPIEILN